MVREILLLGDSRLYTACAEVTPHERTALQPVITDLHDTLAAYHRRHGAGRAIAAPQIGVFKRIICLNTGGLQTVFINPQLSFPDTDQMEVMDDCMSFPHLLVRVLRYRRCSVTFLDMQWQQHSLDFQGDLSELFQHEYDHLDGILATMRAIDSRSFFAKK